MYLKQVALSKYVLIDGRQGLLQNHVQPKLGQQQWFSEETLFS